MKYKIYLFTIILAGCLGFKNLAQPTGWSYAVPIMVTNSGTLTATNYQLNLIIDTQTPIAASQMLPAGDDIRFGKSCDGSVLYNYWIESGINTTTTSIWVNIDTLFASSSRTFYLFYGNSSATAVSSATNVFIGPLSSTDSITSGSAGGVGSSQRGFRFSPNEDILMTHAGKREPTGTTRYVTLFDYNTQAIISQQQVSGAAAQYNYAALTSPIWLTQGTQYVLELYQDVSDGYYFGTSSQVNPHLTYYDMRYCNSCTQNTFPTNTLGGYQYGYPDILFYIKNNILSPAPAYTVYPALSVSVTASFNTICMNDSVTLSAVTIPFTGSGYNWQPGNLNGQIIKVSPTTNTEYTVTANISGCSLSSSTTTSITVNNLPNVTISATSTAVCAGNQTTLSGNGASTYTWTNSVNDGVAFTPTITATYTVTGTDANNCSDTASIAVIVNNLPAVMANATNTVVCAGNQTTLSGSGASTYTWTNSVNDGVAFTPTITATYTVTGTDANNCSDTASIQIIVNNCTTGINNTNNSMLITVYPNPSNGEFTVSISDYTNAFIEIYSGIGQLVISRPFNSAKEQIKLADASNGIYLIRVLQNGALIYQHNVIINK